MIISIFMPNPTFFFEKKALDNKEEEKVTL